MELPVRFLLIDDDKSTNTLTRLTISKVLGQVETVEFTIPENALDFIEQEYKQQPVPTVLFLDINMPSLSGWDVLDRFMNMAEIIIPNFTIYMLSSSISNADKDKAKAHPLVSGFLEKPLARETLRAMFSISHAA